MIGVKVKGQDQNWAKSDKNHIFRVFCYWINFKLGVKVALGLPLN
jgi:hypothetical protein